MKPPGTVAATRATKEPGDDPTPMVDSSRDLAKLMFDRIHAHDAAEAGAKALLAKKVGVKKVKASRR